MNRIKYILIMLVLTSCLVEKEKPKMPVQKFAKQVVEMNTVVTKLMNEQDPKVLHDMAFGVESTRVVLCDPVGNECNLYYQLINKMVFVTNDGVVSDEDRQLLIKMNNDLQNEIKKSEEIVVKDWKEFLDSQAEKK
jgi:hypothetical protein